MVEGVGAGSKIRVSAPLHPCQEEARGESRSFMIRPTCQHRRMHHSEGSTTNLL